MKKLMLIIFTLALAGSNVFAQSTSTSPDSETQASEEYSGHESTAWAVIQEDLSKVVSDEVAAKLSLIAYHAVAEMLCEGVIMDMPKARMATLELHPQNWDELTAEEHTNWNNTILLNYGMIVGVMLAEHADNSAPFCVEANALVEDEAATWHYFYIESE